MQEIGATLIERIKRTEVVESFRFLLTEKISFMPGQFLQVVFDPTNKNNQDLNKYLSISSSPTKDYIEVTKKLSNSVFFQHLKDLNLQQKVLLKMPLGNCVFKDEYKKIGFLIGGIGITPVISIIEYIMDRKLDTDVCLFYSNRSDNDIAFKKELDVWQATNRNIKVNYAITDFKPQNDNYLYGRIDKNLITGKANDWNERILFIFGPPAMVEAMAALSSEMGCNNENLRIEKFLGY